MANQAMTAANHAEVPEDIAHGAAGRPDGGGFTLRKDGEELPGTLGGMPGAELQNGVGDLGRSLVRTGQGKSRAIAESFGSLGLIPPDPFAAGLSAGSVTAAELRHGEQIALGIGNEERVLVHRG